MPPELFNPVMLRPNPHRFRSPQGVSKDQKGSYLAAIAKENEDTLAKCGTHCLGTIDRFIAAPLVFVQVYVLFMLRKFRLSISDGHHEVIFSVNYYRGEP